MLWTEVALDLNSLGGQNFWIEICLLFYIFIFYSYTRKNTIALICMIEYTSNIMIKLHKYTYLCFQWDILPMYVITVCAQYIDPRCLLVEIIELFLTCREIRKHKKST